MAVYTHVSFDELKEFVGLYSIGSLVDAREIIEGVENSNYRITTDKGRFILTMFEKRVAAADLPFFMELMRQGAMKGLPCPMPLAARDGAVLHHLGGQPAAIISFLDGSMAEHITADHCRQIGAILARLHLALRDVTMKRPNALSIAGWEKLVASCQPRADEIAPNLCALITEECAFLRNAWPMEGALPHGVIHADLFIDNVFFKNETLCGLFDFYFACNDFFAYDIAIAINAWCFEKQKDFRPDHAKALLEGYQSVRELEEAEKKALPLFARGSALRFLLTRLYDWLNHPPGALVKPHDPLEYRNKLLHFRTTGLPV